MLSQGDVFHVDLMRGLQLKTLIGEHSTMVKKKEESL